MIHENQLNAAERKVLEAFREGKSGNTEAARKLEETGETLAVDLENHLIHGDFVRGLFCEDYYDKINYRGIIICKAKVNDVLNMAFCKARIPVWFYSCHFDKKVQLEGFECPDLSFAKCNFQQGLDAKQSKIEKSMRLAFCKSVEEVSLSEARIGGQLNCKGASFMNEQGCALSAHNIKVGGCMLLNEEFKSKGKVRLEGAEIGMWLSCSNGNFMNKENCALFAQGIQVRGSVFLNQGFKAEGSVHLSGAEIRGQLSCIGGCFVNKGREALIAQGIKVGDSVIFREGFCVEGGVHLDNAKIGGALDCTGGTFLNEGKSAFIAQNAKINGSVHMSEGFQSGGMVSLGNAEIGGQLICRNGSFINEGGDALFSQCMKVASAVFLSDGFVAKGTVHLAGAEIKGELNCTDGNFINEGNALVAISIKVAADVVIGKNFKATGEVNLYRAKIDGGLLLEKCHFTGLRLTDAQVGTFSDDEVIYTDSDDSHYDINGFSYQRLEDEREETNQVKPRLEWVNSMNRGRFYPQPYEQLMKVYREMGHMNWARKVGFALEEKRRKHMKSIQEPWWKVWQWILKLTIGYGYKPLRFFWLVLLLVSIGGVFFSGALPCGKWEKSALFTGTKDWTGCEAWRAYPSDTRILFSDNWKINKSFPEDYPSFIPFLYAAEVAFPVLPLGQTDKWHLASLRGKFLQGSITLIGTMALAILVFYGVGTLGPRWKE